MTAAERRASSSRRGMTVLGKVPVAPKPINLPSQRLENQGLFSDVDIVRWGSAGRFRGACGNKPRKPDSASSKPFCNGGEKENCGKVEDASTLSTTGSNFEVKDEGGDLPKTSSQFPTSAKAITVQTLQSDGKIAEAMNTTSYTQSSIHGCKQGRTETPLRNCVDGCSAHRVPPPPGFNQCGLHGNHARACSDLQCNGGGHGIPSITSQQTATHSFPVGPRHNTPKEREIIVIHMVGSPGFYGNYPPQLGYPPMYGMNGNFPLQFGNFEPYNGFQGHGRVDYGAQISSVTAPDLLNKHEDYVCYEKECYHGRSKNGLAHGNLQESSFVGVQQQRDLHESMFRSRASSQNHLSTRNVGRLRSAYHNGKLVPIEEVSAPEKRITLLTKVSQHELMTTESQGEPVISEGEHAEYVVGSALLACGDEGKAPETVEADTTIEDAQVKNTRASSCPNMADEVVTNKEMEAGSSEVSVEPTVTCNEKCLHCKAEASTLQCCVRSTRKEVSEKANDKSSISSTDGCVVEVKHVIFDAHRNAEKAEEEDATVSSSKEPGAADKLLDMESTTSQQSLKQNDKQGGKGKDLLWAKKAITNRKWKPKNLVVGAKSGQGNYANKNKEQSTLRRAKKVRQQPPHEEGSLPPEQESALPVKSACQQTSPEEGSLPPEQEAALPVKNSCQQTSPEEESLPPEQEAALPAGSACQQTSPEEMSLPPKRDSALLTVETEEDDAQKLQDVLVDMEMEGVSVQKHTEEEVLPLLASGSLCEGEVEEVLPVSVLNQACSQENRSGNKLRPPFKKKNAMSYEKADRYHQMMFKKYKETGTWKPRAEAHSSKVAKKKKDSASEKKDKEAPIKVEVMVA